MKATWQSRYLSDKQETVRWRMLARRNGLLRYGTTEEQLLEIVAGVAEEHDGNCRSDGTGQHQCPEEPVERSLPHEA